MTLLRNLSHIYDATKNLNLLKGFNLYLNGRFYTLESHPKAWGLIGFYFNARKFQPALLYLVPACLGAPILLALVSGELGKLFEYDEEEQEEEDDDEEEKKDQQIDNLIDNR